MRRHPHLYEINTWPWLERLSGASGRQVTLGTVPASEWDRLQALGFDLIYLMGIWERSAISRQIARSEPSLFKSYDEGLPGWTPQDIVGSPFSIRQYVPDAHLGSWRDLALAREALNGRGMQLILDFVPNHTAFDHPWVTTHPHRYVRASLEQFRAAPQDFRSIETAEDGPQYIACGRDPFFPPWTDVAQLNYFESDTREAMIRQLSEVADHCDGVRCDMAMLVLDEVFARTWGALVGRSDPPGEFWAEVRSELPDLLTIGEVYWDLEPRLQQLGIWHTYDKRFYDAATAGNAEAVRPALAPSEFHNRSVRFLENHDQRRSLDAVGEGRIEAAAVMLATTPGMRMYFDGQIEGRKRFSPVQLGQWADESQHPLITQMYEQLLHVSNDPVFHEGEPMVLDVRDAGEGSARSLVPIWWHSTTSFRLAIANLGETQAQGFVQIPSMLPQGTGPIVFEDLLRFGTYRHDRMELLRQGLYVRLEAGHAHLFILKPST